MTAAPARSDGMEFGSVLLVGLDSNKAPADCITAVHEGSRCRTNCSTFTLSADYLLHTADVPHIGPLALWNARSAKPSAPDVQAQATALAPPSSLHLQLHDHDQGVAQPCGMTTLQHQTRRQIQCATPAVFLRMSNCRHHYTVKHASRCLQQEQSWPSGLLT